MKKQNAIFYLCRILSIYLHIFLNLFINLYNFAILLPLDQLFLLINSPVLHRHHSCTGPIFWATLRGAEWNFRAALKHLALWWQNYAPPGAKLRAREFTTVLDVILISYKAAPHQLCAEFGPRNENVMRGLEGKSRAAAFAADAVGWYLSCMVCMARGAPRSPPRSFNFDSACWAGGLSLIPRVCFAV